MMDNTENKSNYYKMFGYEITDEIDFMDKKFGITPEIGDYIQKLYFEAHEPERGTVKKLKKLIKEYPHIPHFKNYLTAVYDSKGDKVRAYECNKLIQREHPDYLFGRVNLAAQYFEQKEYDKIPEVLGQSMEIQNLYSERSIFHTSEVMAFNRLAVLYYSTIGNLTAARNRFEIMEKIDAEHPDTHKAHKYLLPELMKNAIARKKEKERTKKKVKTKTYDKSIQASKEPEFNHPDIRQLYENGMRIHHQIIKEILDLPRTSLIDDLETILNDVVRRYEYYKNTADEYKWVEEEQTFLIHAFFLLTELNATESLDKILTLLSQDEKLLEFWFSDYLNDEVSRTIYQLGKNQLEKLKQFALKPNVYTYAKSAIITSVEQISYHEPERKPEVVGWIKEVLTFLLDNRDNENLIDSDFIGFTIGCIINLKAKELLPLVYTLFEHELVSVDICGGFNDVEDVIINQQERDYYKFNLLNIFDRYTHILTTWAGYKTDEKDIGSSNYNNYDMADYQPKDLISSVSKTGRNNPCPCGSGKKYKKCCGRK